jgi:hypothetical protein
LPPKEILAVHVLKTIIGGRIVYDGDDRRSPVSAMGVK